MSVFLQIIKAFLLFALLISNSGLMYLILPSITLVTSVFLFINLAEPKSPILIWSFFNKILLKIRNYLRYQTI
jgi:hypothetical protein